jgi:hypothetical protein
VFRNSRIYFLSCATSPPAVHLPATDAPHRSWDGWDGSGFEQRFPSVNWLTQTCTRIDTNSFGIGPLDEPKTGRKNNGMCDCDGDCQLAEVFAQGANADCRNVDFWVTEVLRCLGSLLLWRNRK